MSRREIKIYGAWMASGMVATVVIVVGLKLLGAGDRLMALGGIVALLGTSFGGWFLPEDPPTKHR